MHAKLEHKSDNGLFQSVIVIQNSFPARIRFITDKTTLTYFTH